MVNKGYIIASGFYDVPILPSAWRLKQNLREEDMIKNLSNIRRIPRLGCIRLGIKKISPKTKKEYPAEVDYFILDPSTPSEAENKKLIKQFHELYGERPKQIKIMFPMADVEKYFPQHYKRYGSSTALKCIGDGESAVCTQEEFAKGLKVIGKTEQGLIKVECAGKECIYGKKECSAVGVLQVLLPELQGMGTWQITTGSFHSIVNMNSCIEYIIAVCGRAHMLPLILERRAQETTYEGQKSTHFMLHVNMDLKLEDIQRVAQIEPSKILLEAPALEVVVDAETESGEVNKSTGEVSMTEKEKTQEALRALSEGEDLSTPDGKKDFFEFMLAARAEFKKKKGNDDFYRNELSIFEITVLSDVKDNPKKQVDIRAYFEALLDDMKKGKI